MTALRWLLGISSALLLTVWVLLVIAGKDFRRSWGASPLSPLLPILPGIVFILILATVLWPGQRGLVHVTAVVVGLAIVGSLFILRQSVATGLFGFLYLGSWLGFYWLLTRSELAR